MFFVSGLKLTTKIMQHYVAENLKKFVMKNCNNKRKFQRVVVDLCAEQRKIYVGTNVGFEPNVHHKS